jgi:hypothetical protein
VIPVGITNSLHIGIVIPLKKMTGIAIPEGNDKIFQKKKKKQFFIYLFFSLKLLKKKMLKEKYIWGGRPPTKCPGVA